MVRIAQLIFAATAIWLFYLVLGFSMTVVAGNGGEYWGYDGLTEPWRAAAQSFTAGEKRFLAYKLNTTFGGTKSGYPNVYRCEFHPEFGDGHIRFNTIEAKHGYDSVAKADAFARSFNSSLAALINGERKYWCEKVEPG